MIKNIIFDMDGTLVNSSEDVLSAIKIALTKTGVLIKQELLNERLIGPPLEVMIEKVSPDISAKDLSQSETYFREIYDNSNYDDSFFYSGIDDLLKQLKLQKIPLFLATYKPIVPAEKLLEKFGWQKLFQQILCRDTHSEKYLTKEEMLQEILSTNKLKAQETIMIGDGISDMNAGLKCNLKRIAILYGYSEPTSLLKLEPDYHVESVKELSELLMQLAEL